MGRPIRLTDEERKRSNAERQRRWKARHLGFAKLKERNAWAKRKAIREKATPNEKVFTPNAGGSKGNVQPSLGELRYVSLEEVEADPKVMAEQEQRVEGFRRRMEPKRGGGHRAAEPEEVSETENEARTYAQLEEFRARRALMEKGVQVELIL